MEIWGLGWVVIGLTMPAFIFLMNSNDPKVIFTNLNRLSWSSVFVGFCIISWLSFQNAIGISLAIAGFVLLGNGAFSLVVLRLFRLKWKDEDHKLALRQAEDGQSMTTEELNRFLSE